MDAKQLALRLAQDARGVCQELLPGGVVQGHEWCVGSTDGEKGQSLKVCLSGAKAGIWADFSGTSRGKNAGDLIDLWVAVRQVDMGQALKEIRDYLGIQEPTLRKHQGTKRKTFDRPAPPKDIKPVFKDTNPVEHFLRTERGITKRCMKRYQIGHSNSYAYEKDGEQKTMTGPWCLFPFMRADADGKLQLVNLKWWHIERRTKPTDKWPKGKKIIVQAKNGMPCLWGWQSRLPGDRKLLITEGEVDAMTWRDGLDDGGVLDVTVCSLPAGAGDGHKHDWIDLDWDLLNLYDEIYLAFDDDEEGHVAEADVSGRLGKHRTKLIRMNGPKDANAALIPPQKAKYEAWTPADFARCFENAIEQRPEAIRSPLDFRDQVQELIHPTSRRTVGVQLGVDSRGRTRFRMGEVTVLTGPSGHGKSIFLSQLKLEFADTNEVVFEASMEMKAAETLKRAICQMTRMRRPEAHEIDRALEWLYEAFWLYDVYGTTTPDHLLEHMLYARRRYGCSFFIIDSFMRCGIKIDDLEGQDAFIKRLCVFADEEQCHIVLVAHGRKLEDDSRPMGSFDIKGSGGLTDNAFNVLSVWRNKQKEKRMDEISNLTGAEFDAALAKWIEKPDAKILVEKQRNGSGWIGSINLWYDARSMLYREHRNGDATSLITFVPPNPMAQPDEPVGTQIPERRPDTTSEMPELF